MTLIPVSIQQARKRLTYLVDQVAINKKRFIITKYGKPKAKLTPITLNTSSAS